MASQTGGSNGHETHGPHGLESAYTVPSAAPALELMLSISYARGWSYLTDDPAACANCHVMREQFDGWLKSSHRAVATCNHCHTPANFIGKYATKASNGFWHSFFFTTGGYEDNIQIKPHSRAITEQACRACHEEIVGAIEAVHPASTSGQLACLRCHNSVGHLQ